MLKLALLLNFLLAFAPAFGQLWTYPQAIRRAQSLRQAQEYAAAAALYSSAFQQTTAPEPDDQYNAACAYALAGSPKQALALLRQIVGTTYFNYDQLATDADLATLRTNKRWPVLLDRIRKAHLQTVSRRQAQQDFDLLVASLKEAHAGLYWYTTKPQFDSLCAAQRAKISAHQTVLDFYTLVAPVIGSIREGHTFLHVGSQTQAYLRFSGRYFPGYIKVLNQQVYLVADIRTLKTKGLLLTKINGRPVEDIMRQFMAYEPADGFNTTSKYRWLERGTRFHQYYSRCYPQPTAFSIEVQDPQTRQRQTYSGIAPVGYDALLAGARTATAALTGPTPLPPAVLRLDAATQTAFLTFNTFDAKRYQKTGVTFPEFVQNAFRQIQAQSMRHLVLDIRQNGGGREGYEDYLLSFLVAHDYTKYAYVEASGLTYSFYPFTDHKNDGPQLDSVLSREHYRASDGRLLRRPGIEEHTKPQPNPFRGDIYVLTSGLTYSGGSEFAALVKNYTPAVFIGEEVGGGYYGNSSGIRLTLRLPNSALEIGIPLLKFVVATPAGATVPLGHGVPPDYYVQPTIGQYLSGYDAELAWCKQLIAKSGNAAGHP